jgi:hypothetical protein
MEILAKKATEAPTLPHELNPDVPEALEEVVMHCLERDPERRPQTMGAVEYELNKSMKGRGSAVAAVLGLKTPEAQPSPSWSDESSAPRPFDTGGIQQRRPSMPSIPVRTGQTGAQPLMTDGDRVRVNTARVSATDVADDMKRTAERKQVGRPGRWSKRLGFIGGVAFLGIAGFAAYTQLQKKPNGDSVPPTVEKKTEPTPEIDPGKAKPKEKEETKMSPAEIERMLEWARRAVEGGRIVTPPEDNLKYLLDQIDRSDPGNAQAEALKQKTTQMLGRKGTLALKKGRLDEAEDDFAALAVLKPDDEWTKGRLARTLTMRSQRSMEKNKLQAALHDATKALEMAPDETSTQLTVADVHLAMGKNELAAEEYQRVLDVKPMDKHAKIGLQRATAPKRPVGKKKKGR